MEIFEFGDFTLATWLILGAIGVPALILAYFGTLTFGLPTHGRPLTIAFLKAIPLSVVAWLVTVLALGSASEQAVTGAEGTCQLSGNYSLMMVDDDGSGWVYNRKNEATGGGVNWQRDGIDGVELLQVSGKYILGGRDSRGFRPSKNSAVVNEYFVIDSQTEAVTKASSLPQLQASAAPLGIVVQLRPVREVYANCGEVPSRETPRSQTGVHTIILLLMTGFLYLFVRWVIAIRNLRSALSQLQPPA